ncbi:hypothetical protein ACHMWU_29890 [Aeromicrobium sp. UC242_57]
MTASKTGLAAVSSTSATTAKIAKATSKVSVSSSKSKAKLGQKVKLLDQGVVDRHCSDLRERQARQDAEASRSRARLRTR